jgi:DNA-binding response OmpR family regulator
MPHPEWIEVIPQANRARCPAIPLRVAIAGSGCWLTSALREVLARTGGYEVDVLPVVEAAPRAGILSDTHLVIVENQQLRETVRLVAEIIGAGYRGGIVVLSSDARAEAAAACLEAGADDFIRLPFQAAELIGRVAAVARRIESTAVRALDVHLEANAMAVDIGSWRTHFTKTGFDLFACLARHTGVWITTEELRRRVLRTSFAPGASNVRWHVLKAREALGPFSWCLHGDRQRGYMVKLGSCDAFHCRRATEAGQSATRAHPSGLGR